MHLIQLGITDSRHRVELTTEGLEPYHDTLHVFVDASFHQLVPMWPLSHACSSLQVGWVLRVLR